MSVLAFDLGASSGRAIVGRLLDNQLIIKEIHRFPNTPVQVGQHLHWNILSLFQDIKLGILKSNQLKQELQSMAIDSWALDFGLIASNGELLGNPFHYRDEQTHGMMDEVFSLLSREEIFNLTGIQFMPVNTLYHLYAMKRNQSPILEQADQLLMIPDLLRYFLTGEKQTEYTNATTTQLFNARLQSWDYTLLEKLGIPPHLFAPIIKPASFAGHLLPSVCNEFAITSIPVMAVGEHDTASAVVAVPTDQDEFAYISCGTWSLMGTEISEPLINKAVLDYNFTNEGGINGTIRLLKNIMGLWILQECRRVWGHNNKDISFSDMVDAADHVQPFQSFIDPDDPMFLHPINMPFQIQEYCRKTNQAVPYSVGEIVRCILESLAFKYKMTLDMMEELTGIKYPGLHIVGGGTQNALLCQFTANAIARPVWAGPKEASAIGNIAVQYMGLNQIGSLREARSLIRDSFHISTYEPESIESSADAYARFLKVTNPIEL